MSDIETKKKYVRPAIKLIELARDQVKSGKVALIQPTAPTATSNVTGGAIFGG